MRHFSALAGGAALGIIMIPTILSTTETMMRMVPRAPREGGARARTPLEDLSLRCAQGRARESSRASCSP
jgi:hypothetical protein